VALANTNVGCRIAVSQLLTLRHSACPLKNIALPHSLSCDSLRVPSILYGLSAGRCAAQLKPTDANLQSGMTRAQAAAGSELADGTRSPLPPHSRSVSGTVLGFGRLGFQPTETAPPEPVR